MVDCVKNWTVKERKDFKTEIKSLKKELIIGKYK